VRTIIERAANPAFRLRQVLVSRQVQAGLDLGAIQQSIIFAARDIRQAGQVSEDCSSPILPIQAEKDVFFCKIVCLRICLDCRHSAAQLYAVLAVPRIAVRAEPLMRVRMEDGGAGSDNFPPFAPSVARSTQRA
jgi:hypothetical protein